MSFYKTNSKSKRLRSDRYRLCEELVDSKTSEVLLSTREIEDIRISSSDIFHTVKANEVSRLDLIANTYYKTPLLWWVIAQANNIYDPITPLTVGTVLRIPTLENLYGYKGILL